MLNPDRLRRFMHTFFGYGSWTAPLWFVGMEEGGGASLAEIERRIDAWSGEQLEDLQRFHQAIGITKWFHPNLKLQPTWSKLVRVTLSATRQARDDISVRRYQSEEFGRSHGATAVIELLPLPSPSTAEWIYGSTGLAELSTRANYHRALSRTRLQTIQQCIDRLEPPIVMFYGMGYSKYWESIAGSPFHADGDKGLALARRGRSRLILAPHPTAHGARNTDFDRIGELIAEQLVDSRAASSD